MKYSISSLYVRQSILYWWVLVRIFYKYVIAVHEMIITQHNQLIRFQWILKRTIRTKLTELMRQLRYVMIVACFGENIALPVTWDKWQARVEHVIRQWVIYSRFFEFSPAVSSFMDWSSEFAERVKILICRLFQF